MSIERNGSTDADVPPCTALVAARHVCCVYLPYTGPTCWGEQAGPVLFRAYPVSFYQELLKTLWQHAGWSMVTSG